MTLYRITYRRSRPATKEDTARLKFAAPDSIPGNTIEDKIEEFIVANSFDDAWPYADKIRSQENIIFEGIVESVPVVAIIQSKP